MSENTSGNKRLYRLENESIPKLVLSLSAPAIVGMVVTSLYNMADTFFVGQLGTAATAAVGVIFPLSALFMGLGMMFGVGASSYISRMLGQKDFETANRTVSTSFFSALTVSAIFMMLCYLLLTPVLRLLGATDTILPFAWDYMAYVLPGIPFLASSFVMNHSLRAEGSALYSMIGMSSGAILNVILDPLFIFTFNMGIKGAALATSISQIVSFSILLYRFLSKKSVLTLSPKLFTFKLSMYAEIIKIGFPSLLRQSMTSLAMVLLNAAARPYGDSAIAAVSIVNRVSMFFFSALIGLGQGYQPVVGFNTGAKRPDRVWKAYWFTAITGTVFILSCSILLAIIAPDIMRMFRADDPDVISIGSQMLRFMCIPMPLQAWVIILTMLFQSLGKGTPAAILSFARQGLCFVPLVLILPNLFGLTGVTMTQAGADMLSFLISLMFSFSIIKRLKAEKEAYYSITAAAEPMSAL